MNHLRFPEANVLLTPPEGLDNCEVLVAHHFPADPGAGTPPGYLSRWHPTAAERDAIAAGGDVWVFVYTTDAPPPIAVQGLSPFEEHPAPDLKEVFRDAFHAYEAETGKSVLADWPAWQTWAEEHRQMFEPLCSAADLPQFLARLKTQMKDSPL